MGDIITALSNMIYTAPATTGGAPGGFVGFVGQWVGAITSNPLVLAFALIPLIGLGIGLLRRLFSIN